MLKIRQISPVLWHIHFRTFLLPFLKKIFELKTIHWICTHRYLVAFTFLANINTKHLVIHDLLSQEFFFKDIWVLLIITDTYNIFSWCMFIIWSTIKILIIKKNFRVWMKIAAISETSNIIHWQKCALKLNCRGLWRHNINVCQQSMLIL